MNKTKIRHITHKAYVTCKKYVKRIRQSFQRIWHYTSHASHVSYSSYKSHKSYYIGGLAAFIILTAAGFAVYRYITVPHAPNLREAKSGYLYSAKGHDYTAYIGNRENNRPEVNFAVGSGSVVFTPASGNEKPTAPVKDGSKGVTFKNVYANIDFQYQTIPLGIKENIIINKETPIRTFPFFLDFKNVTPQYAADNVRGTVFYDKDKNYLFNFEKPYAVDAKGVKTTDLGILIKKDTATGKFVAIITLPDSYMRDPKRAYPITVDPTVVHSTSSDFSSGSFDRITDTGSGSSPSLESYYQELSADSHTVGLWHMNESSGTTTVSDSSGNSNTGTSNSSTDVGTGKFGNARTFNGSSDYINIPNTASLNPSDNITISAWVNPASTQVANADILSKHSTSTGGYIIEMTGSANSNAFYFAWGTGSAYQCTGTTVSLTANTWQHIAFSKSGATVNEYINGVLTATCTGSSGTVASNTDAVNIGRWSSGASRYFNGSIDEVRIDNIARSPEQIAADAMRRPSAVYTSPVIDFTQNVTSWNSLSWTENGVATGDGETLANSTSLVAQWNFNETSGTTAAVAAGSCGTSCNGTLTSFASTGSQDAAAGTGWTAANRRWGAGALMFDGSDDHITVTYTSALNLTSDLSLETWIKTSKTGTRQDLIDRYNASSPYPGYDMVIDANGHLGCWVGDNTNGYTTGSKYLADGKWHHVACTLSGTTVSAYVDGKLDTSATRTPSTSETSTNLTIGINGNGTSYPTNGVIDSTRIYSRALTPAEIMSNYNAGNVEFQTRVGTTTDPNDGSWEAWKPTTGETQIDSFDANPTGWNVDTYPNSTALVNTLPNLDTGTGNDGDCVMDNGTKTLDTTAGSSVCNGSARSTAYAVNFSDTTTENVGATSVTVSSTPTGLTAGDEFIIINLQGTSSDYSNVGQYETHTISSISTNTLNFTDYPLEHTYDGTTQTIVVQRVPNFGNVTVCGGATGGGCTAAATLTTSAWDGTKGGVLFFRSTGTVTVNSGGSINADGLGYTGGAIGTYAAGGDAFCGTGGGTGGYYGGTKSGTAGNCGGGGGGSANGGSGGAGSSLLGGAGGGGGWSAGTSTYGGAGGGAGYGTAGSGGGGNTTASSGGTETSGNGSAGNSSTGNGGGGGGGGTYGKNSSERIYFGSGGGAGGAGSGSPNGTGGAGGNGGGIISISADGISISGSISSNGSNGANGIDQDGGGSGRSGGGGGGGAGGNITLLGNSLTLGSSVITASGGSGGTSQNYSGGTGGKGRITTFYNTSISGTTSPSASSQHIANSQVKEEGNNAMQIQAGIPQVDGNTVGLWHLDETGGSGAYIKDSSGNGNDGTPTGTTLVQGVAGKARSFNGSSDYISCTDTACGGTSKLDMGTSNWTTSAWIKTTNTGQGVIVGKDNVSTNNYGWYIDSNGSQHLRAVIGWGTGQVALNGSINITDGNWHNVAGVWDRSGNMSIYVDGKLDNSTNISAYSSNNIDTTAPFVIGARGNSTIDQYFGGTIDEVKVTNTARSAEEIAEDYRMGRDHYLNKTISSTDLSGKTSLPFYVAADRPGTYLNTTVGESAYANYQPDANTVGLWHLDEQSGSGAYIKDSSGNGNNGTPTGTTYAQGKIGKARSFNGSSDYINGGTSTTLKPTRVTLSAWIKTTYSGAAGYFVGKMSTNLGGHTAYYLSMFSAGKMRARITINTSPYTTLDVESPFTTNDGQWHYYVLTYDTGNILSLFIDGKLANSTSGGTGILYESDAAFYIGAENNSGVSDYTAGTVDEVRVDNTARSATEIRQAYEVGRRSHPVTIDFGASLDSGNLITGSGDTSFTVDATTYGLSNKGSNLYLGDKVIVREDYDGTTYIAQGTVNAITASTGAVTVASWDSGSTFPSGGYTANADVFKWQREYWNINEATTQSTDIDAVTNLTLRLTDGSEGRNVWLDDLESSGGYLTTPGGSTITSSTGDRYFQYRIIESSNDPQVSATVSAVTVDYTTQTAPNTPTLDSPTDAASDQSLTPVLKTTATDNQSDNIQYKIRLCEDLAMSSNCQTFDQSSSQTGWSGQNADSGTTYTSGTQGVYTVQSALSAGTTYYWESYAIDPSGTNTFGSTQGTPYSFTTSAAPTAPTSLLTEGATNPTGLTDTTPYFSAIHNDPDGDSANYYQILVNTASDFSGTSMWDSTKTSMTSTANGARSPDITYAGTTPSWGTTYYWKIRFWDTFGNTGAYSSAGQFTLNASPNTPTLDSPTNGATGVTLLPSLLTTSTDADSDYLRYKIQICTNLAMSTGCQTFDETSSQTGWSGQDAQTSTAYASGTQATYTLQSALSTSTTYYWRSYAIDPGGTNNFGSTQGTPYSFTTTAAPAAATACTAHAAPDDSYVEVDWADNATNEDAYEVQRSVDGGSFAVLDTGLAANTTSDTDSTVTDGHTYQYRVAPYLLAGPTYADWCTTATLSLQSSQFIMKGINLKGLNMQ